MSYLLKQFRGQVDLIYIDPPFDSKAEYKKRIQLRRKTIESEQSAFEEKQYTDIWTNDEYLQFMYERLVLCRELLSSTGSIYVHCDTRRGHLIRTLLEEVFGAENFRNDIVWKRTSAHSDSSWFGQVHDYLLFATKGPSPIWNPQKIAYEEWYVERYYRYRDSDGRRFKSGDLSAYGLSGGGYEYTWKGRSGLWRCPESTMRDLDEKGKIYYTENGVPRLKQYLDDMEGLPLQSLWDDVQPVVSWSDETQNYPTQKPESLLERVIAASSNPGGLVFDCFMGSGTTQTAAMKLGRRFIGADINLGAIQTTTKRLIVAADEMSQRKINGETKPFTGFEVYNVNHYDIFRNPVQARDLLIEALEVQKLEFSTVFDGEKNGRMVKIMPVNRIATRADLNELIAGFDYKAWERRQNGNPNRLVEKITLVCMGHEPDLAAQLELAAKPFKIDVEVVDILRDKADLEFKRDSQARLTIKNGELLIERFYPMNLLQKLSLQRESVENWKDLVESVLIDWNYDGAVLQPAVVDIPGRDDLVKGAYKVPDDAGTIRVKITDLLSESWEGSVSNGD